MENKLIKEVTVLLLPPFFNLSKFREKLDNKISKIITLNDLVVGSNLFESNTEKIENNPSFLFQFIKRQNFSELIVNKILNYSDDSKLFILNYYPSTIENAELLISKFKENSIKITKIIFSGFSSNSEIEKDSFERFEKISSSFFVCPSCFNSFDKDLMISENKSSVLCPIDKKTFSLSFSDKFTKLFNQYYFESILTLKPELDNKEIEILPIIAFENDDFEKFFTNEILNKLGNEN